MFDRRSFIHQRSGVFEWISCVGYGSALAFVHMHCCKIILRNVICYPVTSSSFTTTTCDNEDCLISDYCTSENGKHVWSNSFKRPDPTKESDQAFPPTPHPLADFRDGTRSTRKHVRKNRDKVPRPVVSKKASRLRWIAKTLARN